MRNIIIATRDWSELSSFSITSKSEEYWHLINDRDGKSILALYITKSSIVNSNLLEELQKLTGETIILYHGKGYDRLLSLISPLVFEDCGSGGLAEKTDNRKYFELLLLNKTESFDEIWNFFLKKPNDPLKPRLKILNYIYSGKSLDNHILPEEIKYFSEDYIKLKAVVNDQYNHSEIHCKALIKFRDILLDGF